MAVQFVFRVIKIFIYYLFLFAACRFIFLVYFYSQIKSDGLSIFATSLFKALPLDVSMACYLTFLPLLLLFVYAVSGSSIFIKATWFYLLFISSAIVIIGIAQIGVYRELHIQIYYDLVAHLRQPMEAIRSVPTGLLLTILCIADILIYTCFKMVAVLLQHYDLLVIRPINWRNYLKATIVFLFFIPGLIIGCRGGLQNIPINEGNVYFSHNQCANDATVNPLWGLMQSFIENQDVMRGGAYQFMKTEEADAFVHQLYSVPKDTTVSIFKCARPNICIIILESWSAELIESLGGFKGITPNFEQLIKQGLFFTNFKASGHVSDQGVPAILGSSPALTIGSTVNHPDKQAYIPCINRPLSSHGYSSSFFYGGQLNFGNINTYLARNKFDYIIDQSNLPSSIPAGKLGIHDSLMLQMWFDSLQKAKQPFFSGLFTLSTHPPFDAPSAHPITWGNDDMPYLNGAVYTDKQLEIFFGKARKQPWYDSTVFILVADHSHCSSKSPAYDSPEFYGIPLLITGGALKEEFRGVKNNRICSQTDIASTLLHQLGLTRILQLKT